MTWSTSANALPALPPVEHFACRGTAGACGRPACATTTGGSGPHLPRPRPRHLRAHGDRSRGPWSAPHLLLAGRGLIDPCPLWDDDGRTYLVHGWAKSRAGMKNRLTLVEVDAGLRSVVGPSSTVVDGDAIPGCSTLEGPKMYQPRRLVLDLRAGVAASRRGGSTAFRSRDVCGPYEHRIVLEQGAATSTDRTRAPGSTPPTGPTGSCTSRTAAPTDGSCTCSRWLWQPDGWPRIGATTDGEAHAGNPVRTHTVPGSAGSAGGG